MAENDIDNDKNTGMKKLPWSFQDRMKFRQDTSLPILSCRDEFLQRLKLERIVVVVAETGSGKSTQLPQYMAEEFDSLGGIIVCTQPRALAANSVAMRVANEFDGFDFTVGQSVGYKIGGKDKGKKKTGSRIMFITDSQLIREMTNDSTLSNVTALMIDEAHERSLNTDIVVGIAKHLLSIRPFGFYVVIASATIDPKPFLEFFFSDNCNRIRPRSLSSAPINVKGRVYPVDLEYWPNKDFSSSSNSLLRPTNDYWAYVIDSVIKAVRENAVGHALVFLSSQADIDKCIQLFENYDESQKPAHFIALPLCGSLNIDEQKKVTDFDQNKSRCEERMIAFCTNIAETSLTVAGVRIVIDTGLAKESKYDEKRKSNVLELCWISRSSADQRKGRAGRIAPGVCIRLYAEQCLSRESIEPEIQRSNIDLILLQLKCLHLENLELISPPSDQKIVAARENLVYVGAVDENDNVTELGRFYSELTFDPLISAFLTEIYLNYESSLLGVTVASLITAPGDIFYLGNKETREKNLKKVSEKASEFQSDILLKCTIYNMWLESGISILDNMCAGCGRKKSNFSGCSSCRAKYSSENDLNNRVLKSALEKFNEVKMVLEKSRHKLIADEFVTRFFQQQNGNKSSESHDDFNLLSKTLPNWFFEQSAQILVDGFPTYGIRLLQSNERAKIDDTSCLINNKNKKNMTSIEFVISPSACFRIRNSDAKSDTIIAKNLHPIRYEHLVNSRNIAWKRIYLQNMSMSVLYEQTNVGPLLASSRIDSNNGNSRLNQQHWMNHLYDDPPNRFLFVTTIYEKNLQNYKLYGPTELKEQVESIASIRMNEAYQRLINYDKEKPFYYESQFRVFMKAGLVCTRIIPVDENLVLDIYDLNYSNKFEFKKNFFVDFPAVKFDDLLLHTYNPEYKHVRLVFKDEANLNRCQADLEFQKSVKVSKNTSKAFVFKANSSKKPDEELIKSALNVDSPFHALATLKLKEITSKNSYTIKIKHLPGDFDVKNLNLNKPKAICHNKIINNSKLSTGIATLFIKYETLQDAQEALTNFLPLCKPFTATIPSKNGVRNVTKQPTIVEPATEYEYMWEFECSSVEQADLFFEKRDLLKTNLKINISGSQNKKSIKIESAKNIYSKSYLDNVKKKVLNNLNFGQMRDENDESLIITARENTIEFQYKYQKPSINVDLYQNIKKFFDPVTLNSVFKNDPTRTSFFKELFKTKRFLHDLPKQHCVKLIQSTNNFFLIYGEPSAIGSFMRDIADAYDAFLPRYHLKILTLRQDLMFQNNRLGASELEKIKSAFKDQAEVNYFKGNIEIVVNPNNGESDVKRIIEKRVNELVKRFDNLHIDKGCLICGGSQKIKSLSICGHRMCEFCLKSVSDQTDVYPLVCNLCNTPIEIDDFINRENKAETNSLVNKSLKFFLQQKSSGQYSFEYEFCPLDCGQLIHKSNGFSKCKKCNKMVCIYCKTDNELHMGRSCREFETLIKGNESLVEIIEVLKNESRIWLDNNWPPNMPKIIETQANPFFQNTENLLVKKFVGGLKNLNISENTNWISRGIFAWHGTSTEAIYPICKDGFDPKKRSGQAYGSGEYFGVTAGVSDGYCRGGKMMLVSFILNGNHSKHIQNFCYVVANPIDNQHVFSVPILIVNFGDHSQQIQSLFPMTLSHKIAFSPSEVVEIYSKIARWQWHDGTKYEPYSQANEKILEQAYTLFLNSSQKNKLILKGVTQYVIDRPQDYEIDFEKMIQINTNTGYQRKIIRDFVTMCPYDGTYTWRFLDSNGSWQDFENLVQGNLEEHYKIFKSGTSNTNERFLYRCAPRQDTYEINFGSLVQTNLLSQTVRKIERISN
ncbi:uncharacterized protein LOC136089200 [Hydra vulgaris]|uniref:Uncharacterized protein LOC136089200 n=1 Tax=Hydra vulgaris TaxID=6087 RepID=A0ABM4D9I4_HYDVU